MQLIIGIKSRPESLDRRSFIRQTWLERFDFRLQYIFKNNKNTIDFWFIFENLWEDREKWKSLNFTIKPVFIIAATDESLLKEELKKFGDILLLDFKENFYRLPAKEAHFLRFIEYHCSGKWLLKILNVMKSPTLSHIKFYSHAGGWPLGWP